VNPNGTFNGSAHVPGRIDVLGSFLDACTGRGIGYTPPSGTPGTPYVPSFTATDPVTGGSATAGPNGAAFANGSASTSVAAGGVSTNGTVTATTLSDGAGTTITGGSVTTNSLNAGSVTATTISDGAGTTITGGTVTTNTVTAGTVNATTVNAGSVTANSVSATTLSTQDSHGFVYANVGDTLTAYGHHIAANTAGIANLNALYSAQQGQINNLNHRMDKAYGGIAMATAFEAPQVDPGKHFGFSVNYADFAGFSGFSGVGKLRFDDHWSVTGGVAGSQNGQFAGKVGIQTQW
jgi:hypothetical protein